MACCRLAFFQHAHHLRNNITGALNNHAVTNANIFVISSVLCNVALTTTPPTVIGSSLAIGAAHQCA